MCRKTKHRDIFNNNNNHHHTGLALNELTMQELTFFGGKVPTLITQGSQDCHKNKPKYLGLILSLWNFNNSMNGELHN